MQIQRQQLDDAAAAGLLAPAQVGPLWDFLATQSAQTPSFRATHILYYLGGLLAIGAMSLFMTLGWDLWGGWGLLLIALAYALLGLGLTEYCLRRPGLRIPAGIAAAFVVVLTPLAIYGLQAGLGYWEMSEEYRDYHVRIDWRWLWMELATLVVGAIMLWRYRLPFLMLPVAVTLWYLSMDLTPILFHDSDLQWQLRKWVSVYVGLLMLGLAFWIELRTRSREDFAFWLYLFGLLAFWVALTSMDSDSELKRLAYCLLNLGLLLIGAVLSRRVFAVFGGLGVAAYVGHLAYSVFRDSLLFPLALTVLGAAVVYLGIVWQRYEARITARLRQYLPAALQELLARRQFS
ncbi:hypothetical protein [Chitinibacter tainanensis]|uniref:hypothetical protein n=1 Tax=Chitinibacter tainanensis TaxID=230667 RepID=UPI00041BA932|nr:hypothetical protein [Chitinibacter tainanensis]